MTIPTVSQLSPQTSLTVRAEHFISPRGHRLNSWCIVDGSTVVATMKDLGPGTEALARKLAASLDLLGALKPCSFQLATLCAAHGEFGDAAARALDAAQAALAKAEGK